MAKKIGITILTTLIIILSIYILKQFQSTDILNLSKDSFKSVKPTANEGFDLDKEFETLKNDALKTKGTHAIYIVTSSGDTFEINSLENMYAASIYKVPLAVAVLKKIEQDSRFSANENVLPNLISMLKNSDNTSQAILTSYLNTKEQQDAFTLGGALPLSKFYHENISNPVEISTYFLILEKSNYINENSKKLLYENLTSTSFEDRISLGLGSKSSFIHKIGNWAQTGSWHDCGLARQAEKTIVVCYMSKDTTFEDAQILTKKIGNFIEKSF